MKISYENFDEHCFAYVEGQLSSEEEKELLEFAENDPSLQTELNVWRQTLLVPDARIVFPGKNRLKKKEATVIPLRPLIGFISVAAAAAIAVFFYFRSTGIQEGESIPTAPVAKISEPQLSSPNQPETNPMNNSVASITAGIPLQSSDKTSRQDTSVIVHPQSRRQTIEIASLSMLPGDLFPVKIKTSRPHYHEAQVVQPTLAQSAPMTAPEKIFHFASAMGDELYHLSGRGTSASQRSFKIDTKLFAFEHK